MGPIAPGPLFTKRADVLPQDLVKTRNHKIRISTFPIALKCDRHLGSSAAEMPVKFQSDTVITTSNLDLTRLDGKMSYRLVNRGPNWVKLSANYLPEG